MLFFCAKSPQNAWIFVKKSLTLHHVFHGIRLLGSGHCLWRFTSHFFTPTLSKREGVGVFISVRFRAMGEI